MSNLLLILVLNLLVKPFYILGIDAEVQNRVGEAVYGDYFSLLNFSFLLNILLDFGLTNYNTRNIAQYPKLVANHFGKILSLRFLLFFLYAGVTLFAGWAIGYSGQEYYLLSVLMVNQFLVAVVQFARSNFAGLHLFKADAFISVLDRSLLIAICAIMLWTDWFGGEVKIEWFVYAQTAAYGLAALIAVVMLFIRVKKVQLKLKKAFSFYILKQSFPYALLILLMMMYSRIDAVMLERLMPNGDEAAGIYAQGFRLLDAVNMFALLFAGLLLPVFSRLIRNKESVAEMTALSFRLLLGISMIVGVTCFFFRHELITLRYPDSPAVSAASFGVLILSFIPVALTYVFGTLLTANGSLRYLNQMAFGGVLLNITLNYVLIQYYGVAGAALATLITQTVTALIQIGVAYRIFKFKFPLRYYLSLSGLLAGLLGGYYFLERMFTNRLELILPYFIFALVLGFLLRVFKISDLKEVLSR